MLLGQLKILVIKSKFLLGHKTNVSNKEKDHFIISITENLMELLGSNLYLISLLKVNKESMEEKQDRDFIQSFQFIDHKAMVVQMFMTTLLLYGKNKLNLVEEDKHLLPAGQLSKKKMSIC